MSREIWQRYAFTRCAAAVLFGALQTAGCGGSDSDQERSGAAQSAVQGSSASRSVDACTQLTEAEIASAVGNPVLKGQHDIGTAVCKWNTEDPTQVSVLLMVYAAGGDREKALCPELRKGAGPVTAGGQPLAGLGDVAMWKYASGSTFNSGDLELCAPKGFVSLSLNGKRDEGTLKAAATTLAQKVLQRP